MNLNNLVEQLKNQAAQKFDVVVPSKNLDWRNNQLVINTDIFNPTIDAILAKNNIVREAHKSNNTFDLTDTFRHQIAEKLGIPYAYFDRMWVEAPDLLEENIRWWLMCADKNYLVRSFLTSNGGLARAFLSDGFKIIDHIDVLMTALNGIQQSGAKVNIEECTLSEKSMRIKVVDPTHHDNEELKRQLTVMENAGANIDGKGYASGFIIGNSETGEGRFYISPLVYTFACRNFHIFRSMEMSRVHLGSKQVEGVIEWSQETMNKEMALIQSQVKDAVHTFLAPEFLGRMVGTMLKAQMTPIKQPTTDVPSILKNYNLSEKTSEDILNHFIQGGNITVMGLSEAVTRYANTACDDVDIRNDLEELGEKILETVEVLK